MIRQVITVVLLGSLLQGCSTLGSRQLLMADENWHQLGFNKGKWGEKATAEQTLLRDAKKVGEDISVDYPAYLQGYQEGLETYCTLEQMKQLGLEGKMEWGVCEFRREEGGLYQMFWQQGFERYVSFDGVGRH
ncbi:DUF2799 domain-containing protein [Photobacterium sp. SDRW27]|uniref:DUF2799 domain-containing protein n=1 Tax=Photobacterium obscurum TaxID=2829490 RepID=UPI0022448818|nr:DUF2799 domain-containing protein [Photobacterium obscurum]MCW8330634.1 DUF2799 domain-containing protein [Photobacterium obscurum]